MQTCIPSCLFKILNFLEYDNYNKYITAYKCNYQCIFAFEFYELSEFDKYIIWYIPYCTSVITLLKEWAKNDI